MFTIKTNQHTEALITQLRDQGRKHNCKLWFALAANLEKPNAQYSIVNLSKLAVYTKDKDVVIVPGKVLAGGNLDHSLTIAAFRFSSEAKKKIEARKGKALSITQMLHENPQGKQVRIIG